MDIDAYLNRIGYSGSRDVTFENLCALQSAHLQAVPFENLSIHNDEPIILDDIHLFDKVIRRGRGGFCYELNGLFSTLLRQLGFSVDRLSARVARGGGELSPEFAHMTLLVNLDQRWLVDVGFGDTFRQPLAVDVTDIQSQLCGDYRIEPDGVYFIMHERKPGETWAPGFRFSTHPYDYAAFEACCHFQQTSPDSTFVSRGPLCTLATPTGRKTLSRERYIITTLAGEREERALVDQTEFDKVLKVEFGIAL